MFGLPRDLDLGFLIGADLIQVCIGANEVILNFFMDISITIMSKFRVRGASGPDAVFEDAPSSAASLIEFLSDSITDVFGQQNGTLRLLFKGGGLIEIYDDSKCYESYLIKHGPDIHVV